MSQNRVRSFLQSKAVRYIQVIIGSALYAVSFSFFLFPNSISTGGVSGIAMIINAISGLPVGMVTIVLNVPLFIAAWRKLGLDFMIFSLVGMLLSSALIDIFTLTGVSATNNLLLAAVYAGVIEGLGEGLLYLANANTGGMDIAAKLVKHRYQHIQMGTIVFVLNVLIIAVYAVVLKKYESAMYAVIAMYISTHVIDIVLYGTSVSKMCYIITDKSEEITQLISDVLRRGVTYLHGEGAYSGTQKKVILCVIKKPEIVTLRRLVQQVDESAFMIIGEAKEVFGEGFQRIDENR